MYTPKAFEVTDLAMLHAAMKQSELATLVTTTTRGLVATHLPLLLDETRGEYGTLTGHVSRANLQWRETDPEAEALIIFLGLDTYVSPNWYPAKQETGRVVPTWNYAAIHAYGRLTFFEDRRAAKDSGHRADQEARGFVPCSLAGHRCSRCVYRLAAQGDCRF